MTKLPEIVRLLNWVQKWYCGHAQRNNDKNNWYTQQYKHSLNKTSKYYGITF